MSLTIGTIINGTLTLIRSYNPVTILPTGGVKATATGAEAIDGNVAAAWVIWNAGTISSLSGYGGSLAGPNSNVINFGSISGAGGIALSHDGSVTNTVTGRITATGKMPSPLSTISGIYITGPSNAGMAAISVINAGVVTAADGYGIGLGASGSVYNFGRVTGGEDGIVVLAGVGNIQNSGSVTATHDDGISLFQGGAVTNGRGGVHLRGRRRGRGRDFRHRRKRDDNKQRTDQWLSLRHPSRRWRLGNERLRAGQSRARVLASP